MHHLSNNELTESHKRQSQILNSDGIICHSFWKGVVSQIFNGLFVNYHTEVDHKEIFKNYFEVLSIETYKEFDDNDSILILGKKN